MRNMSFALTTKQCKAKIKTVTRRLGWKNLKPGERVQQVEKGQGLKKGEHLVKIHVIECVRNKPERLIELANIQYGKEECRKEGFPGMTGLEFIAMFCRHNKCIPGTTVTALSSSTYECRRTPIGLSCGGGGRDYPRLH